MEPQTLTLAGLAPADWRLWPDLAFDGLLGLGLLWLGWRCVASPDLFRAIALLITLGLFMALCWARLEAVDVALAEAAIGSGLTGALLLNAHRELHASHPHRPHRLGFGRLGLAALTLTLAAALGWGVLAGGPPGAEPGAQVRERLGESGVGNPVTAVLLNFRSYDTLLEVVVLLLGLVGVWTVSRDPALPRRPLGPADSPLVVSLFRWLGPLSVLVAAYLLWAGAHAPGGAFQAAAVLAGFIVLLCLAGRLVPDPAPPAWLRGLLLLGPATFCAVAWGVMAAGGGLLEYPPGRAGTLILIIESTLSLSLALILALLFAACPGLRGARP